MTCHNIYWGVQKSDLITPARRVKTPTSTRPHYPLPSNPPTSIMTPFTATAPVTPTNPPEEQERDLLAELEQMERDLMSNFKTVATLKEKEVKRRQTLTETTVGAHAVLATTVPGGVETQAVPATILPGGVETQAVPATTVPCGDAPSTISTATTGEEAIAAVTDPSTGGEGDDYCEITTLENQGTNVDSEALDAASDIANKLLQEINLADVFQGVKRIDYLLRKARGVRVIGTPPKNPFSKRKRDEGEDDKGSRYNKRSMKQSSRGTK